MTGAESAAVICLLAWLYLILLHGGFWLARQHEDNDGPPERDARLPWPRVTAVIPARNEADMLPRALRSLIEQDYAGDLSIIIVDDQSTDATGAIARQIGADAGRRVDVIAGAGLPPGWTGKVWAMHQGIARAEAEADPPRYLLLTDADISYAPDALSHLVRRAEAGGYVLTSLMARLRCESFAERALVPAFVFFFQMLYPFAWVNRPGARTAAAAGGSMLADRAALARIGGIAAIRGALIDDCALARLMKARGPIWLGLARRVTSLREYPRVGDIRRMVARSAYAQLNYSPLLLIGTLVGMTCVYLAAPVLAASAAMPASMIALAAYGLMVLSFQPTLRNYRVSPVWALALPLIAAVYVLFTLDSAYQHARGRGGWWKGRAQALGGAGA